MLANYHTHTTRCKHAVGTEREYVEEAIKNGFKILGFSDHTPQPYPNGFVSGIRMDMSELPDYVDTILSLKEEYKGDIDILIGYEVEYSQYFDELLKELRKYPLDYLLLGQHYVKDEVNGFYVGAFANNNLTNEQLVECVDHTIEGMRTGMFTYLAHPDLFAFEGRDEFYLKEMARLVEASIECDMPLEINYYGFVDSRNYPCDRFFSLASKMGAKFVLGCDAHEPGLLRQPEDVPGLMDFLNRNNISITDNILKLKRL